MARVSARSASRQRPASAAAPIGPSTTRSQNRRSERPPRRVCAARTRKRPISAARSPIRAGNSASMRSRSRRASTGDVPPVPIATTTSPRSTMAGKMNVESSGRSTTLTGTCRLLASTAMSSSSASPAADTTATQSAKSAWRGSAKQISSGPDNAAVSISSATPTSLEYQRTRAPAERSRRSLLSAAGPAPTRPTTPCERSRNTGKKRIGSNSTQWKNDFPYNTEIRLSNRRIFYLLIRERENASTARRPEIRGIWSPRDALIRGSFELIPRTVLRIGALIVCPTAPQPGKAALTRADP